MVEAVTLGDEERKHIAGDAHDINKLIGEMSSVEQVSLEVIVELHKEDESEWWDDHTEDESKPSFIRAKKIHRGLFAGLKIVDFRGITDCLWSGCRFCKAFHSWR